MTRNQFLMFLGSIFLNCLVLIGAATVALAYGAMFLVSLPFILLAMLEDP